ncbi:MAG: hypothetical protein P1V97_04700 [Planctomycetota bacterium]|nr:hypothetical protein [Planctomycetota bacterium]
MVRRADELFLAIAVKNELLEKGRARAVLDDLKDLDSAGTPRKARHLCLERGLLSNKLAKQVKMLVMEQLSTEQVDRKKTRKKIGGYKLGKQLNATRLGVLYRAQDPAGGPVLLKVLGDALLPPDGSDTKNYLRQLKQVIPLLDCGEEKGTVFVVLEDVQGEALSRRIRRQNLLDERGATRLALSLSDVLKEAAEQDLYHGFINPTSIIYDEGGPRLMEIGVLPEGLKTRAIDEAAYRAPETLGGDPFDLRADIYSLGAVLYHAVSGRMPFESVDAIRFDPLPSLQTLNPKLSPGFCQLIEAMMSRKVEQRYQNYKALVGDLDNVIAGFAPALELGVFMGTGASRGGRSSARSSTRGSSRGNKGLRSPTRKGPAVAREDRVAPRRRRDRDGDEEVVNQTSSMLPVAALGIAALTFIGAIFFFSSGNKDDDANKGKTVVVKNNDNDNEVDYLEKAAQKAYDEAITFKQWNRLDRFEKLLNDYGKTEVAVKVTREAKILRQSLVAEELGNYKKAKLRIDGLKASGEWINAISEFETLVANLRGEKLLIDAKKELALLKSTRLQRLKEINAKADRFARSQGYGKAIEVLKGSMGFRDEADRKATRGKITVLEGQLASLISDRKKALRLKHEKAVLSFERSLKERGKLKQFKSILNEGQKLLAELDRKTERGLYNRVDLHVRACGGLSQLNNMVSAAALELFGKELEVQQVKGSTLKGKLIDVDGDGGLILQVRGGELTITRDKVSLETQELILLRGKKANYKGLMTVGLCWIYQGEYQEGMKRLLKAQKRGYADASFFLDARKELKRIFGGEDVKDPDPVVKKDPVTKKDPDKKPEIEPVSMEDLYDNLRTFYVSANEVGFNNGRLDAIYDFYSGAKKLNPKDWDIRGRKIYNNAERQAVVLEGAGALYHRVNLAKDFTMRISLSYANTLVKRSGIRLVIIDQKKKEEYRSLFGQQLFHYKRNRLRRREGLQVISQDLLKPKTIHKLEIGYKNGEVWTKLNGEQHGLIKGAGISKALIGLTWDKMSINLHSVRIEGYIDDEYARKKIDEKNKKGKKKSGKK